MIRRITLNGLREIMDPIATLQDDVRTKTIIFHLKRS
jgi:hypothetical protein